MKVIFLDFDGVLSADPIKCDFGLVPNLNAIFDQTGAGIVFSTSWRYAYTIAQMAQMLRDHGLELSVPVLGQTPITRGENGCTVMASRCAEVRQWLGANPRIENFVIIDDTVFADFPRSHTVECLWGHGLTTQKAEEAMVILNGPNADEFTFEADNHWEKP